VDREKGPQVASQRLVGIGIVGTTRILRDFEKEVT